MTHGLYVTPGNTPPAAAEGAFDTYLKGCSETLNEYEIRRGDGTNREQAKQRFEVLLNMLFCIQNFTNQSDSPPFLIQRTYLEDYLQAHSSFFSIVAACLSPPIPV